MEPDPPPSKGSNARQKIGPSVSVGKRFQSVVKEALKLENLPFVALILLAGISLISRLWLIRH
jgi:hypothetical protein